MAGHLIPHVVNPRGVLPSARLSISEKFAAIFGVILILGAANIVVVREMLKDLNGVAETINVAGRLRMLSQKIAFETTRILREQGRGKDKVAAVLVEFETGLNALSRGGAAFGYDVKTAPPQLHPLLAAARTDWERYRGHVEAALLRSTQTANFAAELQQITDGSARLLEDAEAVVRSVTLQSKQSQQHTLTLLYGLLLLDLIAVAIVFWTVRTTIVNPLRDLTKWSQALAAGNYRARQPLPSNDEISLLAEALSHSAQQIGDLIERINEDRENLRNAEAMFRGLAENSVVGVYIIQDETFRFANSKMAEMFGYNRNELMSSVRIFDMVVKEDWPRVVEATQKRLRGEIQDINYEFRGRKKDNSVFNVEVFGSMMKCSDKVAIIGVMVDATERKRAAADLLEAKRRLELALEGSNSAIWDADPRTGELYLSPGWAAMLGEKPKETRTTVKDLLKLVAPTEVEPLVQLAKRVIKGEHPYYSAEHRVRTRTGEWKWILSRGAVIERDAEGRATRMSGTNADITELRKAEQALRESEARFRSLVALSSDWYWEQDQNYRNNYVSPKYSAKTGLRMKPTLGQTRFETDNIWESEDQKRKHREDLDARRRFRDLRLARYDEDGELHYFSISGEPVLDDQGHFTGYRGTGQDITEEKRAEAEIRRLNAKLEARVAERTAQLVAANKELEAFSYSVSHDLRAPLHRIDGFSQLLFKKYADSLDATGKDYLQRVRTGCQRMGQLINDMLELSRLSRSEMHRGKVDLSKIVEGIAAELRQTQPEREVELAITPKLEATANPKLIRIALENLLSNAWKFTGRNAHARIEFGAFQEKDGPVFFIRDNGVGFDMIYATKLFTPFQRLHSADEFEGTGIGLATVQRVIARHGGRVRAESAVNQGATFYFTLPS